MKTRIQVEVEVSLVADTKGLAAEQGISYSQFVQNALAHTLVRALQGETIDEYGIANEVAAEPSSTVERAPESKPASTPPTETERAPESPKLYRRGTYGLEVVEPGAKLYGDELMEVEDKTALNGRRVEPYKPSKS